MYMPILWLQRQTAIARLINGGSSAGKRVVDRSCHVYAYSHRIAGAVKRLGCRPPMLFALPKVI